MNTMIRPDLRQRLTLLAITVVLAFLLIQATAAQAAPQLPLKTQGGTIVDAAGKEVVLQGVNWFGFETANHAPHGLWTRDYKDMLAQIKSQGFNTIRMPFSLQMLDSTTTSGIDYSNGNNAALQGKTPQQVMDIIIAEAGRQGLMIILDNHSSTDDSYMNPLWYGVGGYTEDNWVAAWSKLAARYANTPNVIGADLKNEPHGEATWGTGAANDWRRAAERGGNAVLASAPNWLVLVEGIEGPVAGGQQLDRHWWGGNLEGVRNNPVRLSIANRVVYSPHEYGPGVFAQPWFSDPNMASILADRWQKGFGYIKESGIAPILIGEFGAKNVGTDTVEGRWINQFTAYLEQQGISWTFWAWNPNSGDTGGVLQDDWRTVHADKMALLTRLMRRPADGGTAPAPTPTPGAISTRIAIDSQWTGGWCGKFVVGNATSTDLMIDGITFSLPTGGTVSSTWGGTFTHTGNDYSVVLPTWAKAVVGGSYADTGLCVSGSTAGQLNSVVVTTHTVGTTPTPTPAPGTVALTASVVKDSTWAAGFCRSFTIANAGTRSSTNWKLVFTLPSTVKITDSWNGTLTRNGNVVTVAAPGWAAAVAPRTSVAAFGFCATGTGEPTAISVTEVASTTTAVATARSGSIAPAKLRARAKAAAIRHAHAAYLKSAGAKH